MAAMVMALSSVVALSLTGFALVCALTSLWRRGTALIGAGTALLMACSTVDMMIPGVALLPAIAWTGLLVGAALLQLLNRGERAQTAQHAAAFLLMAAMWATMPAVPVPVPAGSASPAVGHASHVVDGVPLGSAAFIVAALVVSVVLVVVAVRTTRTARTTPHAPRTAPRTTWQRIESLQHTSMAIGMSVMAVGMFVPSLVG